MKKIIFLLFFTILYAETICSPLPNGTIVCTDDDGDNTFIIVTPTYSKT